MTKDELDEMIADLAGLREILEEAGVSDSEVGQALRKYYVDCELESDLLKLRDGEDAPPGPIIGGIFWVDSEAPHPTVELLLELKRYGKIPKTNRNYRYDAGNTNTQTRDHIHILAGRKELYAINRDGTPHDGSRYQLSKRDINFLKSIGFHPPKDGLLEWIVPDQNRFKYAAVLLMD